MLFSLYFHCFVLYVYYVVIKKKIENCSVTIEVKHKANVYKSRGKTISRNVIHTDDGISVKIPNIELSDSMIKGLKKKK